MNIFKFLNIVFFKIKSYATKNTKEHLTTINEVIKLHSCKIVTERLNELSRLSELLKFCSKLFQQSAVQLLEV